MMALMKIIFLIVCILNLTNGVDIQIDWRLQSYEPIDAHEGDTLTFIFDNSHDVYKLPSEKEYQNCEFGNFVGGRSDSPAVFTVEANNGGNPLFYACGVGTHCSQSDMKIAVNVLPSDDDVAVNPSPTLAPSIRRTNRPTLNQNPAPTLAPSAQPSNQPTIHPIAAPTPAPSAQPSNQPTIHPIAAPTLAPSAQPSNQPTIHPIAAPTINNPEPTGAPSLRAVPILTSGTPSSSYSFSYSYSHSLSYPYTI